MWWWLLLIWEWEDRSIRIWQKMVNLKFREQESAWKNRVFLGCEMSPIHKCRHRLEGVQLQPGEGAGHGRREHHGCFDQLLPDGGGTGVTHHGKGNHRPRDVSKDDCWGRAARLHPVLWQLYSQCHTWLWSPMSKSAGLDLKQAWVRAAKVTQGKESLSYKHRNSVWRGFLTELNTGWGEACTKHLICVSVCMYVSYAFMDS